MRRLLRACWRTVSGRSLICRRLWLGPVATPARAGWFAGLLADELPGHDHGGGPPQHGLVVFGPPFVVADQAPVPVHPAEATFHDPPAGQHDEPAEVVAALDDGDGHGQHG